jgi:hypothetical protein
VVASTEVEGGKEEKWRMKDILYVRNQMPSDAKKFRLKRRAYQVERRDGASSSCRDEGRRAWKDMGPVERPEWRS